MTDPVRAAAEELWDAGGWLRAVAIRPVETPIHRIDEAVAQWDRAVQKTAAALAADREPEPVEEQAQQKSAEPERERLTEGDWWERLGEDVGRQIQEKERQAAEAETTPNACSFLYGRAQRALTALGYDYTRTKTYTRADKSEGEKP